MKVLVVNAGSSSLKYQLIEMETETVLCKGVVEKIGLEGSLITHKYGDKKVVIEDTINDHTKAFNLLMECLVNKEYGVIDSVKEIAAIGHRVVHCGEEFDSSVYVGDDEMKKLKSVAHLAPLHNPANLACIESCKAILPDVSNVAVFDTAFHSTMPKKASMYGIPYEIYEKYQIRRYGFHGTSHKFVSGEAIKYLTAKGLPCANIVTCHLGNGSSISAVKDGKCVDTSMGMTPMAGVMMGTRCGDIDPAVVEMIADNTGMSLKETTNYLNKQSGFLGVSGVSSDARMLCAAADEGNERAQLAKDMFAYQVKKFIGSYAVAMNGLDCVVFTGGIGENSYEFRELIMSETEFLGIEFDRDKNRSKEARGNFCELNTARSKVKVLVIPTNEELVIARETKEIVESL
ncbi:MAG: acetate/propionate family kinase [Christensenellales bacterium]